MTSSHSARPPAPSVRPSSRPVSADFVAAMRRLWVSHDPLRFVGPGAETFDAYDHQAYVTALCADEIRSVADAEKVLSTILRHEFGIRSAIWSDPTFAPRLQRLAQDVFCAVERATPRVSTRPYALPDAAATTRRA